MTVILGIYSYRLQVHLMTVIAIMAMSHIKKGFFFKGVKFILFN